MLIESCVPHDLLIQVSDIIVYMKLSNFMISIHLLIHFIISIHLFRPRRETSVPPSTTVEGGEEGRTREGSELGGAEKNRDEREGAGGGQLGSPKKKVSWDSEIVQCTWVGILRKSIDMPIFKCGKCDMIVLYRDIGMLMFSSFQ